MPTSPVFMPHARSADLASCCRAGGNAPLNGTDVLPVRGTRHLSASALPSTLRCALDVLVKEPPDAVSGTTAPGREQVLEVVQQHQHLPAPQRHGKQVGQRRRVPLIHPQPPGDGAQHQPGIAQRRQIDEDGAWCASTSPQRSGRNSAARPSTRSRAARGAWRLARSAPVAPASTVAIFSSAALASGCQDELRGSATVRRRSSSGVPTSCQRRSGPRPGSLPCRLLRRC